MTAFEKRQNPRDECSFVILINPRLFGEIAI